MKDNNMESYFDGSISEYIGIWVVSVFATLFTLGLATPWVICMYTNYEVTHTVVNGRRLGFDGSGISLIIDMALWFLLAIISFGLLSFILPVKFYQWKARHIVFD